jgi:hypothetical protein
VRIYPDGRTQTLAAPQVHNQLNHDPTAAAAPPAPANLPILPRELAGAELKSLMAVADPLTAGYAALLLSGISPYELPLLHSACFDSSGDRIEVPGASRREITIGQGAWRRLEPVLAEMAGSKMAVPLPELDQRLVGCAREAQLADPGSINALSLWHSYVLYLVRQGIDASALAARAGAIPPDVHGTMMHFAPPGGNRPLSSIEFIHPILVS